MIDEFKNRTDFPSPWYYNIGIYGQFKENPVIGEGAAGIVLKGKWFGRNAAFKFVHIRSQQFEDSVLDNLKNLKKKLSEMTSMQTTKGTKMVKFLGHYR